MNKKNKVYLNLLAVLVIVFSVFGLKDSAFAIGPCFCVKNDRSSADCRPVNTGGLCFPVPADTSVDCTLQYATGSLTASQVCDSLYLQFKPVNNSVVNPDKTAGKTFGSFLPACVTEPTVVGECRDITVFLILMFNIISYLFSIIGGVALLYFVYGGFVLILSQGNSEKVAQGKGIIVAAVLGIIIAFSGYAIIIFVGEAVGISDEFKINK